MAVNFTSVETVVRFVLGVVDRKAVVLPSWPADAFGVCAYLLDASGTYDHVLRNGWPTTHTNVEKWQANARRLGAQWLSLQAEQYLPDEVADFWDSIWKHRDVRLVDLSKRESVHVEIIDALVKICIAADEAHACLNYIGLIDDTQFEKEVRGVYTAWPTGDSPKGVFLEFRDTCSRLLEEGMKNRESGSTLCQTIDPAILRVLPKQKTPEVGISLRSLTHNLGLWTKNEVVPQWNSMTFDPVFSPQKNRGLNMLLVPWPKRILPSQFGVCSSSSSIIDMPDRFSFFSFDPSSPNSYQEAAQMLVYVDGLLRKARLEIGRIDMLVFPELSLTDKVFEFLTDNITDVIIVAGLAGSGLSSSAAPCDNQLRVKLPTVKSLNFQSPAISQSKHHRWQLEKSQIVQYGLGTILDTDRTWWESMEVDRRALNFIQLSDRFVLTSIVCEDLARQEPVAKLIRAVGPNLVIALLMDGPQLKGRWPNRYATVLADDPSSSVLTLTSIGMAELSRPPSVTVSSRSIGLWKDPRSQAVEIELANGADAVVLCLSMTKSTFHSADGRKSRFRNITPVFAGVHQICLGSN